MGEEKSYTCKSCNEKFHSLGQIKSHVKEDHGMNITDEEAKMMEEHEQEHNHV